MLTRPMLAAKATDAELQQLKWPMLLSPKIDGIRAVVVNGQLLSRTLKPIRNRHTQTLFGRPELEGLDGELVVGNPYDKNLMQQTSSGVMSYDGRPDVKYFVFDKWDMDSSFNVRLCLSLDYLCRTPQTYHVKHTLIHSYEEMLFYEQFYLTQGYEGVMLRHPLGPYKQNRSTLREAYLVKVKRFEDGEAAITGYEPLLRNLNEAQVDERGYTKRSHSLEGKVSDEALGKVFVRDLATGVEFSVGSGFTEAQRYDLWETREVLAGRVIKYKSFKNAGVKDAPRHPIFLGFRDVEDL